jgi:hypothetical protein
MMLPNPLSYVVETVLKRPRLSEPVPPQTFKRMYQIIMKARTWDELYSGVRLVSGTRQLTCFDFDIVRRQQAECEEAHVLRLKRMKATTLRFSSASEWAQIMLRNNIDISISDDEAVELGNRLDAAYHFEKDTWQAATASKSLYNPKHHGNDWTDMQQTMYLSDPAIYVLTADRRLCRKIAGSRQANRVLYLPEYLKGRGLSL